MRVEGNAPPPRSKFPVAVFSALLAVTLPAQDVVMLGPTEPLATAADRRLAPASFLAPLSLFSAVPLEYGPIALRPRLSYRYMYAEGLRAPDGRHINSVIESFSPGLLIDLGDKWSLDYAPSWLNYTARAMRDTTAQSLRLKGAVTHDRWAFEFTEAFSSSTPTLVETGRQTKQRTWATQLGISRQMGARWSLQTTLGLNERYAETSPDTRMWSAATWANLQVASGLSLGAGVTAGYSDIVGEPDRTNESYELRLNWRPSEHWSLAVQGGLEESSSRSSRIPDQSNPTYSVSFGYQPFSVTRLSITGSRGVSDSYFTLSTTETTSWSASLDQRLLGHFYLNVGFTKSDSDYTAAAGSVVANRSDELEMFSARLSTVLLKRWSVAAVYSDSRNRSNLGAFDLDTTQYGVEVGVRF